MVRNPTSKRKVARKPNGKSLQQAMLDKQGQDYARLLRDPVRAPLCHPVYPGSGSGYLFRAQSLFQLAISPLETAGFVRWTPNGMDGPNNDVTYGSTATTSALATGSNTAPGKAFLQSNASSYRTVAASMRIYFNGTELNRSGRVHFGNVPDGVVIIGTTYGINGLQVLCEHSSRTPDDYVETIWLPKDGDFEFVDPIAAASKLERSRMNGLMTAFSGLSPGTGITVECTAVYEWQPQINLGISASNLDKNTTSNTFDNVVDFLLKNGETFARGVYDHAPTAFAMGATVAANRAVRQIRY